jgi:hypothetical protein
LLSKHMKPSTAAKIGAVSLFASLGTQMSLFTSN